MAFNINQFRDHFAKHNDFAKTSKFDVRITAPTRLGLDATDLRFQCETTELPGYTVNTVDGRYYGVSSPVASFPTFGDLTLTFICSGDFWEKKLFDKWLNLVIPFDTSYNPNYRIAYLAPSLEINQFAEATTQGVEGEDDRPIIMYKVQFYNIFPTSIAPMSLNWADDGIHRLAVTFRYEYWLTGDLERAVYKDGRTPSNPSQPASGSQPPVTDQRPSSKPQTTQPQPPFKGGEGGGFAGGGASGSY
jgi:hypothetical protein